MLVMIINSNAVQRRQQVNLDLRAETDRLEEELLEGQKGLVVLRNSLNTTEEQIVTTQGLSKQIITVLKQKSIELADMEKTTQARIEHIERLQADLKSLDEGAKRQEAGSEGRKQGKKVRTHAGQGERQYLTGLKVGGKRILILVDASASMLDKTIVNIIRLRNLPKDQRIRAKKWRRAVATVDWLTSQIPASSQFQIYVFNETSKPLIAGTDAKWLPASGGTSLNTAVSNLKQTVPENGTSLYRAFSTIKAMSPRPDNIILLTDGLPTLGKAKSSKRKVSGKQRLNYFTEALDQLPSKIPVNIILFPIEGDPYAASTFWRLAIQTQGSLLSPSEDWP